MTERKARWPLLRQSIPSCDLSTRPIGLRVLLVAHGATQRDPWGRRPHLIAMAEPEASATTEQQSNDRAAGESAGEEGDSSVLLSFGTPVEDEEFMAELRYRLWSDLLHRPTSSLQFPGSQPVSFTRRHLDLLEREDYYVCEKSDGMRYLLYYTAPYGRSTAFLVGAPRAVGRVRELTASG